MFLVPSKVFELMKYKFSNYILFHFHLCGFQITYEVKQCTTYQRTNYHDTTNHSRYLHGLNCFGHMIYAL